METSTIYQKWQSLRKDQPQLRIRDLATQLGVSEGEIIASRVGVDVVRLLPDWKVLMPAIESFGSIMALTRNEYCVHERKGAYIDTTIADNGKVGLVVSPDIDLRFFLSGWGSVFAVTDQVPNHIMKSGVLQSIQIFDKQGIAVHKVYLIEGSNFEAWQPFIDRFVDPEQSHSLMLEPAPLPEMTIADDELDVEAFRTSWSELKDTHHFIELLKNYKLARTQALRLAGKQWSEKLPIEALTQVFRKASEQKQQIMIFAGNNGCIQIHTGLVENLKWVNGWFNVLDPLFDLHLKVEGIAELWRVRKPTTEGIITSIEAYDVNGNMVVQLFGPRKLGIPERAVWRELAESIPCLEDI